MHVVLGSLWNMQHARTWVLVRTGIYNIQTHRMVRTGIYSIQTHMMVRTAYSHFGKNQSGFQKWAHGYGYPCRSDAQTCWRRATVLRNTDEDSSVTPHTHTSGTAKLDPVDTMTAIGTTGTLRHRRQISIAVLCRQDSSSWEHPTSGRSAQRSILWAGEQLMGAPYGQDSSPRMGSSCTNQTECSTPCMWSSLRCC